MGFVSQLVRCGAVSSPREDGEGDGSCSKFDRPHQQLPCQILPREASAAKRLRSNLFSILLLALLALPAFGAKQLGTITASGPIYLLGANVPGAAATSLPLLEGDRVVTGMTSTAVIQFLDSSRVDVFEESDLKVKVVDEETVICLEEGSIRFAAAPEARLVVCARDRRIEINAPSEGTITIDEESGQVVIEADEGAVTLLEERECSCDSKFPVLPFFLGAAGATAGTIAIIREEQPPRSGSAP